MTVLLNAITSDTTSSSAEATGPVLLSILGSTQSGVIMVEADIGSGYSVAFKKTKEDQVGFRRLEFASGVTFRVVASGLSSGDEITVEYINTI